MVEVGLLVLLRLGEHPLPQRLPGHLKPHRHPLKCRLVPQLPDPRLVLPELAPRLVQLRQRVRELPPPLVQLRRQLCKLVLPRGTTSLSLAACGPCSLPGASFACTQHLPGNKGSTRFSPGHRPSSLLRPQVVPLLRLLDPAERQNYHLAAKERTALPGQPERCPDARERLNCSATRTA